MKCITAASLLFLANCGYPVSRSGIPYDVVGKLNVAAIQPTQIDAAWKLAQARWGAAELTPSVLFEASPMNVEGKLLAGATVETQISVYLEPGLEGCLFDASNSGALEHEMGHALQFLHGLNDGDAGHNDSRWSHTDGDRDTLDNEYCKNKQP